MGGQRSPGKPFAIEKMEVWRARYGDGAHHWQDQAGAHGQRRGREGELGMPGASSACRRMGAFDAATRLLHGAHRPVTQPGRLSRSAVGTTR